MNIKGYFGGNIKAFVLLLLALAAVPLAQMHGLKMMPGNLGDARLNNYFLENIYQFLAGRSDSLWHLGFFYPFPYVLGFSDNLFGSAPVYIMMRVITGHADTAFQLWFLVGYIANFYAAYYALRRLGCTQTSSFVGALIFTFALPTSAHAGHAQLHYRFGIPLATVFFAEFLSQKRLNPFIISGAWLVWQFYCGVYMGFFTILLLVAMSIVYFAHSKFWLKTKLTESLPEFLVDWRSRQAKQKAKIIFLILLLLCLLIVLFYPYLQVTKLYGAKRSWTEIATMLPRPESYFLSDASYLWSTSNARIFADIPMRHEHQMFIGVIPLLLAVAGFLIGSRNTHGQAYTLLVGALGVIIAMTLYLGGFSLWYLVHKLPLASAIRVMTRIDQMLLFPIAYLAAVTIDQIRTNTKYGTKLIWAIIIPLMIFEFSATNLGTSLKADWRKRLAETESILPKQLPEDAIVFFAQRKGPFYADELDAMWVALEHGVKTINGYSGIYPTGYSFEYGSDCSQLPRRLLSYAGFAKQADEFNSYHRLFQRTVLVGFGGCDEKWLTSPPTTSTTDHVYTADEFRKLSLGFVDKTSSNNQSFVRIKIKNFADSLFAASSSVGKPIRLSWRFLNTNGTPASGWETRMDLPFDVPAQSDIIVRIAIAPNTEVKGGTLQVSLVQEGVFWGHDIGVKPIEVKWGK